MHVNDEWPREEIPPGNAYCSRHVGRVRKFVRSKRTTHRTDKLEARWCGNVRKQSKQPPLGQV